MASPYSTLILERQQTGLSLKINRLTPNNPLARNLQYLFFFNRTVYTFVGSPEAVVNGALAAARVAASMIDMSSHHGEHPRMGALDVCPFIPVQVHSITPSWPAVYVRFSQCSHPSFSFRA